MEELPKDKYFKIGEVAEEKGFSIQTLRYYDKIGLIKPKYINPETNYRYYSGTQFYKLEIIKYLKSLDVSNEELLRLCDDNDIDKWDEIFLNLSKSVRRRIDELYQSITRIDSLRSRIRYLKSVNEHENIYYQHFDTRYVVARECHTLPTKDETISGFTALYKDVARYSLNNLFQSGAILSYNEEMTQLRYEQIYVEVSNSPDLVNVPNHRVLPAGLYICINNMLFDAEEKSKILLDYIRASGIKPRLIVEEYVFTNFTDYDDPQMALQILE